jgi:protein-tyrosine-phosphatase
MKVLFLCTDNYTRSITAEFCMKNYLQQNKITNIEVTSAGFKANSDLSTFSNIHFDRMKQLKIDTSSFKRTQFHPNFLNDYDVVIGMGQEHKDYIKNEFNQRIYLFNEIYKNEESSIIVPPPDQEGNYLVQLEAMVDYIHDAMPHVIINLQERNFELTKKGI